MIGCQLLKVAAFLQTCGALKALDGAPFFVPDGPCSLDLFALQIGDVDESGAVLYLGTSDVCPAAAGWAATVLAKAVGTADYELWFARLFVYDRDVRVRGSEDTLWTWSWSGWEGAGAGTRETILPGPPPSTSAARLAAVLNYELERSR